MALSATVPPIAQSVFKFQSFRSNRQLWRSTATTTTRTRNVSGLPTTSRRFARIPLYLLLPPHIHLRPPLLQIRRRSLLSHPPLLPLLRSRPRPLSPPMSSVANSNPTTSNKTERVVVKGRVQGVFYRNWTVENATELGLKGWVRNRRDGSVEALFSGSPDKVQEMEQRCRRGPPDAMVTGLEVFPCDEDPGTRFERRSTV